jgi:hypothetical protein
MANVFGGLFIAIGMIVMAGIWIYTTAAFFAAGDTGLGFISLVVPPAAIVLPFVISPVLGFIGIAASVMAFASFAMRRD